MFTMIICNVRAEREEYRKQKAATTLRKPFTDLGVMTFAAQKDPPEPNILTIEDWPHLDGRRKKAIAGRSKCFIDEINTESPLLGNETILSDFVTVLKTDYLGQRAGTAVLKRVTDKADLYYISSFAEAEPNGAISFRKPPVIAAEYVPRLRIGETVVITLLMELAKGLAGAVGKEIGAQLLGAIFPQGSQIDYKALVNDLALVVKEANKEQTIGEQGGKINGILSDITVYYLERKRRSTANKEDLYGYLEERHASIAESLGILKRKELAKKAIATFVSGAVVDFTLYQEMALEDPLCSDPTQSSNIASLKTAVTKAITHVRETVGQIISEGVNTRIGAISEAYNNPWCDVNLSKSRWYFCDSDVKKLFGPYEQCGKKDDPEARCRKAREDYFNTVKSAKNTEITSQVQWMLDNATLWEGLLEKPLGRCAQVSDENGTTNIAQIS